MFQKYNKKIYEKISRTRLIKLQDIGEFKLADRKLLENVLQLHISKKFGSYACISLVSMNMLTTSLKRCNKPVKLQSKKLRLYFCIDSWITFKIMYCSKSTYTLMKCPHPYSWQTSV